jgi:hypothetical protein
MQPCRNQRTASKGDSSGHEQEPEERYVRTPESHSILSAERLFEVARRIISTRSSSFVGKGRGRRMSPVIGKVARVPDLEAAGDTKA